MSRIGKIWRAGATALAFLSTSHHALAATGCHENAFIVFDGSASMENPAGNSARSKLTIARQAVADVLPDVTHRRPTGLIVYSGQRALRQYGGCSAVETRVPVQTGNATRIIAELDALVPDGFTPLSQAVQLAADNLNSLDQPGVVVLVTDGLENCLSNPCYMAEGLKRDGYRVRVHVITFLLGSVPKNLSCMSRHTGGTYAETDSLETLREALRQTLGCSYLF